MRLKMGRRPGEPKETVTIRLTPNARIMVTKIKESLQRNRGFYSDRKYTNSLVIEQAIGIYYKKKEADFKTDFKFCGICRQAIRREEQI
jgi:hypothetical protein